MSEVNDPHAEAMLLVQVAMRGGEAEGVCADKAVFCGVQTSIGRAVMYVEAEDALEGCPVFQTAEDAAAWIVTADREDSYRVTELGNAITNWRRLAADLRAAGDADSLFQLGTALLDAVANTATDNPFDDDEEWGDEEDG